MNDFDQRWQKLAQQARYSPEEESENLPLGFSTRVLARLQQAPTEAWEEIFNAFGLRAVLASALIFLASAAWVIAQVEPLRLDSSWVETPSLTGLLLP